MTFLLIIGFFILLIGGMVSIIFLIAGLAYLSRKSKRSKIKETLPSDIEYIVDVRLNTPSANEKIHKLKAFQFSGVLYVKDNIAIVVGTGGQLYEFPLASSVITWPGVQIQNGIIQWLCIDNMAGQKLYVNAETGIFAFRLSSKLQSTKDVFGKLRAMQAVNPA